MDLFDGTFGDVPTKTEREKARAEKAERDADLKARAEKAEQLEDYLREELTKAEREAADYSEQIIDATRDLEIALGERDEARELLIYRDGGAHDVDCRGRDDESRCRCGHVSVREYLARESGGEGS